MTRLASPPALPSPDTTVPGLARRRVWVAPEVRSHSLAVLTLGRLHLAPPAAVLPKKDVIAAIENGADLDAALGPLATVVELRTVRRATLNLLTNTLTLESAAGGRATRVAVGFAAAETADAVFTKVWRRLGDGFALAPPAADPWDLARIPVAFMAAILASTGLLAVGLNALADSPGHGLPFPGWFDWRLVCGVGGAAMAVVQVWLYRRLTRPPSRLELLPR